MKLLAFLAAGLVAASAVTPAPAEAQRYGYDRYDRGRNDRGYDRRYDRDRRHWDNRRWDRGRHHGWRDRSRLRCTWVRGWYGPERRCWRTYR